MLGYLRLIRLPNVFTAWADILLGACAARAALELPWNCASLPWLHLLASSCLYLSGMAFNDLADRNEDALTRPGRPLPSGAVTLRGACLLALLLLLGGLAAAWAQDLLTFGCAVGLAAAILGYDWAAKRHAILGPLFLGLCRGLNVQLGMCAAEGFAPERAWGAQWLTLGAPALCVGLYAAGVTFFSAQEERGARADSLAAGWGCLAAGFCLAAYSAPRPVTWLVLLLLAAGLAERSVRLVWLGGTRNAKELVRTGVLGLCLLDAGLLLGYAGPRAWPLALLLVFFLLPAWWLGQALGQREA